MTSFLLLCLSEIFQMGSTLKGKNLLPEEQILSLKGDACLEREAKMKMVDELLC